MISDLLIDQTVTRFPRFLRSEISVAALEKGGSDRKYYRIQTGAAQSLILVKYGEQREENRHYVGIARFLASFGVRVPQIYHHDEEEGLIWMEDLGEGDLWSARAEPWPVRRALYRSALAELARLHSDGIEQPGLAELRLQPGFDAGLYRWEQNYFLEHCLGRHFGLAPAQLAAFRDDAELARMAAELEALPRVLVHRDFQSQNIMLVGDDAYLIDFQGLRPGLPHYDLASLLYDPYVTFTSAERIELRDLYRALAAEAGLRLGDDFNQVLDRCAAQRLMQALGAYGFLGDVQGRTAFLAHIPPAIRSLREVAGRMPELARLKTLLGELG